MAAAALAIATVIIAWELRREERDVIERRLTDQALLIAELLSHDPAASPDAALDDEADRLAQFIDGRVTLIAADGRVVGDSDARRRGARRAREPPASGPRCRLARASGVGVVERYSTTVERDMLYAAVPRRASRRSRTSAWRCR